MNREQICRAFCEDVEVHTVPMGFAVRTPFTRPDGDNIAIYIRKMPHTGEVRIEDDGTTIAFLESHGVDLETESRREIFSRLLQDFAADFDEEEVVIHSPYIKTQDIGSRALKFMELMLHIYDIHFTNAKQVARTFKEDLGNLVQNTFVGGHKIEIDAAIDEEMQDYVADYIVRSPNGGALAIYAGNTDVKALEALLFWRELSERRIENCKAMIVLEQPKPPAIKNRTLSRVHNSGLILGSFQNDRAALADKMRLTLDGFSGVAA